MGTAIPSCSTRSIVFICNRSIIGVRLPFHPLLILLKAAIVNQDQNQLYSLQISAADGIAFSF